MNLKRYRVNNIQEALQQIKKDLGSDAIIVSTRQVKEGKGIFGLFGKTMLEVTAARDDKKAPGKSDSAEMAPAPKPASYGPAAYGSPAPKPEIAAAPAATVQDTRRILLPIQQEIHELREIVQDLGKRPN